MNEKESIDQLKKACMCLYLELPKSIAADVQQKAMAVIALLCSRPAPTYAWAVKGPDGKMRGYGSTECEAWEQAFDIPDETNWMIYAVDKEDEGFRAVRVEVREAENGA